MTIQVHKIKVERAEFINYCYLFADVDSSDAALVDPAWDKDKIESYIFSLSLKLKYILITHGHFDHINLAYYFAEKYNIPICLHDFEMKKFQNNTHAKLTSIFNFDAVWMGDTNLFSIPLGSGFIYGLHTPGHTSGSMCFYTDDKLITGDTLFIEGCGICTGRSGDPAEMFRSLGLIKRLATPETIIYPGHCYGVEPGLAFKEVLKKNIYFHINEYEKFAGFRMRKQQKNIFNFK